MDALSELKSAPCHLPVLHFKMQDSARVLPDMKSSDLVTCIHQHSFTQALLSMGIIVSTGSAGGFVLK